MGAIFLNTPDPIMVPATIRMAVVKPIERMRGILDSSIMLSVILVLICMLIVLFICLMNLEILFAKSQVLHSD